MSNQLIILEKPNKGGRPRKLLTENEEKEDLEQKKSQKKAAKNAYMNKYYHENAERICEKKRKAAAEKNALFKALVEEHNQLVLKESSNLEDK